MKRTCRMDLAGAFFTLSLMVGIVSSSVCVAGTRGRPVSPASGSSHVVADGDSLGSAVRPIRLNVTEVSASRRTTSGSPARFEIRLGPLRAAFHGGPPAALHAGGVLDANTDAVWAAETNIYSGGAMEVALDRFGGLFFDGGRVLPRDPLDVLGRGGAGADYWSTSAGIEVHY